GCSGHRRRLDWGELQCADRVVPPQLPRGVSDGRRRTRYRDGMNRSEARLFPALLRHWRTRHGLSQLDLALAADVSPRHVSFLETGRAQPSREMFLRLGATLGVPLRDQNAMLRAAGFPDEFPEPGLGDGLPAGITQAIERMLRQHEPFPMTVLDRHYNLL